MGNASTFPAENMGMVRWFRATIMTTQREVYEAFLNFDYEPARASNIEIRVTGDDWDYLISSDKLVLAKRRAIGELVVYANTPVSRRDYSWGFSDFPRFSTARRHYREFMRRVRSMDTGSLSSFSRIDERPPALENVAPL